MEPVSLLVVYSWLLRACLIIRAARGHSSAGSSTARLVSSCYALSRLSRCARHLWVGKQSIYLFIWGRKCQAGPVSGVIASLPAFIACLVSSHSSRFGAHVNFLYLVLLCFVSSRLGAHVNSLYLVLLCFVSSLSLHTSPLGWPLGWQTINLFIYLGRKCQAGPISGVIACG